MKTRNKLNDLKPLVVVGLSGGVDSAVAAYLLKKSKMYEVVCVFMQNWDEYVNNENYGQKNGIQMKFEGCSSVDDFNDAKKIAKHLNLPLIYLNLVDQYWNLVFKKTLEIFKNGDTPNPDVLCNKHIKFKLFLDYAMNTLDADYIATGHYAKIIYKKNKPSLYMAKDKNKDQSYFLCEIENESLKKILFPLGDLTKPEVREIAKKAKIPVYNKKDSTGICFIGERNFKNFLSNYITFKEGNIANVMTNEIIGKHDGLSFYTIGQRKNLNIKNQPCSFYVCDKDKEKNILYVVPNEHADEKLTSYKTIFSVNKWIKKANTNKTLLCRFRHRGKIVKCKLKKLNENEYIVEYKSGMKSVTPGQYVVIYDNLGLCYGGGPVKKVIM